MGPGWSAVGLVLRLYTNLWITLLVASISRVPWPWTRRPAFVDTWLAVWFGMVTIEWLQLLV